MQNLEKQQVPLDLSVLPAEDLRHVMYQRLHRHDAGGPPLDPRGDEPAYSWLEQMYFDQEASRQGLMNRILAGFLEKLDDDPQGWPEYSRFELLDLLQTTGGAPVDEALWKALRRYSKGDMEMCAAILKVLLARGHKGTREFWLEWFLRLGPEYGALILGGLAQHGPHTFSKNLAQLIKHPDALGGFLLFLPELEDKWGRDNLMYTIKLQWRLLHSEAKEAILEEYPDILAEVVVAADNISQKAAVPYSGMSIYGKEVMNWIKGLGESRRYFDPEDRSWMMMGAVIDGHSDSSIVADMIVPPRDGPIGLFGIISVS